VAVLKEHGIEASAVEGAQSQFDVIADGELVFSKQRAGRWHEEDEILAALDGR
jgi:Rdx family protein